VKLGQAFEVFGEIVAAGLEGSIRARRLDPERIELDVDDHRLGSLKWQGVAEPGRHAQRFGCECQPLYGNASDGTVA
jgi:hypothetical protein